MSKLTLLKAVLYVLFLAMAILLFAIGVALFSPSHAGELRSRHVKVGDCSTMAEGWICYDTESQKKIDASMAEGISCLVNLKNCESSKAKVASSLSAQREEKIPEWYRKRWVQITIGASLAFGLGLGIGSTF